MGLRQVAADNDEAWQSQFVACLGTIDAIVLTLGRRHRLSADAAAELASMVRLRMITDDYAILRKFEHRSSLKTYLTVVIQRLFLDERTARMGKWRPSRQAVREGPTAVLFERLTTRDGLTFEEACTALQVNHRVPIDRDALESVYKRVRRYPVRRFFATDESLETLPAASPSPEAALADSERAELVGRARIALARAVASLNMQDRRILQLRFAHGCSIADVARMLGLRQKPLYSRCERLLQSLRARLEQDGFIGRELLDILGRADLDFAAGATGDRPSSSRPATRVSDSTGGPHAIGYRRLDQGRLCPLPTA
jgi:RNA polymerase sigma factor (sigma-70 family)